MSNGFRSNLKLAGQGIGKSLLATAFGVLAAGCHIGAAPLQAPKTAGELTISGPPNVRSQTDPVRRRVWVLTGDGVFFHDEARPEKTFVRLPNWTRLDAPYGCPPDIALGPAGEAVITSNALSTLWRIDPETLAVSEHELALDADLGKEVGFSGLLYSSAHGAFFAISDAHGSLWRIDPQLRTAQKIQLSAPIPKTCGLAVRSQSAQRKSIRPAGLCLRGPQDGWAIDLSLDQRSAYVRTVSCIER